MINLVVDLILMGGLSTYFWYLAATKRQNSTRTRTAKKWMNTYGPALLVTIGSCLILADPIRHVLQDKHMWHAPMYIKNCPVRALQQPIRTCSQPSDCGVHDCGGGFFADQAGTDCFTCWEDDGICSEGAETFRCLSTIGWVFTIFCSYIGFALFFTGVLWNYDLVSKIRRKWSALTSS
mmetsp:Transcript_19018/g.47079  ORF Transcript_19018/g.47079 Transcript_19018/m.47079 type:complete len:179 (-) Transcript_19018:1911-2447(-)